MAKKKKNLGVFALLFVAFLILGAGAGYGIGTWMKHNMKGLGLPGWYVVGMLPVVMYLAILLHEVGHVVAGISQGMEFRYLTVGPLQLEKNFGGVKLSLNRALSTWGGLAACVATNEAMTDVNLLRGVLLRFTAGGPLASVVGALGIPAATYLMREHPYWGVFLGELGFISASLALATLVPLSFGGYSSDGRRIFDLLRGNRAANRWAALSAITTLMMTRRTKDWPREIVDFATDNLDETADSVSAMWFRHLWHDARGETVEARTWLERALGSIECWPAANRPLIAASAASFYALREKDIDQARNYLEQALKPGFLQKESKLMAQAAVAALEGKAEETRTLLADLRQLSTKLPVHLQQDLEEEMAATEQLLSA